jgi:hypothetical protein
LHPPTAQVCQSTVGALAIIYCLKPVLHDTLVKEPVEAARRLLLSAPDKPDNTTTWFPAVRWSPDAERDRGPLRHLRDADNRADNRPRKAGVSASAISAGEKGCSGHGALLARANATAERSVQPSP